MDRLIAAYFVAPLALPLIVSALALQILRELPSLGPTAGLPTSG